MIILYYSLCQGKLPSDVLTYFYVFWHCLSHIFCKYQSVVFKNYWGTNPNCGHYILIHLMKPFWCTFTLMKVPSLASWASVSLGREMNTFYSQAQWSVSQPMLRVALVSSTAFWGLFSIFTNILESKNLEVELFNYCHMTKKIHLGN